MRIGLAYHRQVPDNRRSINRLKNAVYRRFQGKEAEIQPTSARGITLFEISTEELSFFKIFHSAFATPGRYVMEIFLRLSSLDEDSAQGSFIFNPFFNIPHDVVDKILDVLQLCHDTSGIRVLCDKQGVPLGYLLPQRVSIAEARYLSLLSTMDAEIDAQFLRNAFLAETECIYVNSFTLNKKKADNGFYYNKYFERIFTWSAESAIKALSTQQGCRMDNDMLMSLGPADLLRLNRKRDSIPFVAIMPHHAGDVLFFALVLKRYKTYFNKIVINKWYADIIRDCAPGITPVILDLLPPIREGNMKTEEEYFWDVAAFLSGNDINNNFYYFCRPSRDYQISAFHLIDHFAFALGSSLVSNSSLSCNRLDKTNIPPKEVQGPLRILLHFEGGWPLKIYPKKYQQALMQKFRSAGFEVTILTSNTEYAGTYHTERYKDLAQFKELLSSHHLLIGLDSFPVHYAAHIAAYPTICLFGNTKPVNSNAHASQRYVFLENNLGCAGCGGFNKCPINRKTNCDNFPNPERIFKAAVAMLNGLYANIHKTSDELQ